MAAHVYQSRRDDGREKFELRNADFGLRIEKQRLDSSIHNPQSAFHNC
jgi:hypothetical protein